MAKSHANNREKGLSLIGVVLSLMILVTVALLAGRAAVQNRRVSALSRDKFIAANLAREGLELIRAQRDTNQMDGDNNTSWVFSICDDTIPDTEQSFTVSSVSGPDIFFSADASQPQLFLNNGFYTHEDNPDSTPTPYKRIITVDCSYVDKAEADLNNKPVYITVTSEVTWDYRGEEQDVTLITRLYDWNK